MTTKHRPRSDASGLGSSGWGSAGLDRTDLRLAPLAATDASGMSSETLFIECGLQRRASLVRHRWQAASPGSGSALRRSTLLSGQWRVQDLLHGAGLPVADQIGYEPEPGFVGSPFLVMRRVAGNGPVDGPPYFTEGWLHEASPAEQRAVFDSAMDTMARVTLPTSM